MESHYNLRSPAVKRLMKEASELREPTELFYAQPIEDNLFEWHFTVRGPPDTEFEGGIYHGRILLPPEYPMKPPSIMILTPNGRFEVNKKICLSISGYHPESWQPSWSIRTALLAIIGFMPTRGAGAVGSLDYTPEERRQLARKSLDSKCPTCGVMREVLPPITDASKPFTDEARKLAQQISFKDERERSSSSIGDSPQNLDAPDSPIGINAETDSNAAASVPGGAPSIENQITDSVLRQRRTTETRVVGGNADSVNTLATNSSSSNILQLLAIILVVFAIAILVFRRALMSFWSVDSQPGT